MAVKIGAKKRKFENSKNQVESNYLCLLSSNTYQVTIFVMCLSAVLFQVGHACDNVSIDNDTCLYICNGMRASIFDKESFWLMPPQLDVTSSTLIVARLSYKLPSRYFT